MLFAHLKRILQLDRLRLRGPNGARDEFVLAATAQNLRKLAKLVRYRTSNQHEIKDRTSAATPHDDIRPIYCAQLTDLFNRIGLKADLSG